MIYDVVIVGGGPVGLFLACELRLAEVSVAVVEQAEGLRSPLKRLPFGLRGLSAATTEAFHRRGLLSEIIAAQQSAGRGLLLNFGDPAPLQSTGQRWARRLNYVCCDAKERFGLSAVPVRPDGVVAWISEGAADVHAADRAVARWFGADG